MAFIKPLVLGSVSLVLTLGASTSLPAQCRLCTQPTTSSPALGSDDGLSLNIETNLNFDRLILAAAGQGAAIVRPDGSSLAEGSVASVSGRAMVGLASVRGTPGRAIRVELPSRIDLFSTTGGRIALDDLVTDLPDTPKLDAAGNLSFHFGGRVTVTGDADGNYRGEMPITVEYQ
jgi:hypothetical protein